MNPLPTVTKNLLIINVLMFLATLAAERYGIDLGDYLGLHFILSDRFNAAQLITYMFMHAGFLHVFFNMFAVWMFGRILEQVWGPKRFLFYYMICGIGAGLIQELVTGIHYYTLQAGLPPEAVEAVMRDGANALREYKNYIDPTMASLNLTLNGSTVVQDAEELGIKVSNGYELQRQAGKYYALEFAERIIDGNYYSSGSFNQTSDYLDSQTKYLTSAFENNGAKEIGILIDGTWWENEASSIFESMAKRYPGSGKGERRFGIMPFPMPDGEESRSQSSAVVEHLMSAAFINKNIADYKKDLAIDFIRFCATDESLIEFTKITSAPKAFQYDLTTQLSELTYFGQQVWSFKQNSKVVYKFSDTPLYYMNTNYFQNNNWESGIQTVPSVALEEGMSSEDYFTGMYSTAKTSWANLIQ